ncbi:MAG: hypothetical protein QOC87_851 [Actinomycetota bacterium]|jgi:peptidoglycan/xylan/chitin deacetylase (PgdA/CDA1 family)|nr:hypothetical protein [Actinomycetota bacterium]
MTDRRLDPLIIALHGIEYIPVRYDPQRLFVAPSTLRWLVERLNDWGYEFVRFSDMARAVARDGGHGRVALTFDDGYRNNLYELVPILHATEAVATVFPVTGWLGKVHPDAPNRPILTRDELRILHAEGVEIGSHTVTHRDLSTADPTEATWELKTSREILAEIIESPINTLAYPFGNATKETVALCRDLGFVAACRTSGRGSWNDPLDLPRQDVGNRPSRLGLELKRRDLYEPLMRYLPLRGARRILYVAQKRLL